MTALVTRTVLAALPSITVTNAAEFTSAGVSVPLNTTDMSMDVNGAGWIGATSVTVAIDSSADGVSWQNEGTITATDASLLASACSVGFLMAPNQNASMKVRGRMSVQTGTPIALVGHLTSVP
jgi:hypothetical protein